MPDPAAVLRRLSPFDWRCAYHGVTCAANRSRAAGAGPIAGRAGAEGDLMTYRLATTGRKASAPETSGVAISVLAGSA